MTHFKFYASLNPDFDALVAHGWLVNDSPPWLPDVIGNQRRAGPGEKAPMTWIYFGEND